MKLHCLVFTLDEKGLDLFSLVVVWRVDNAWNLRTHVSFSAVAAGQVKSLETRSF
jgi:hypothetical protein